MIDCRIQKEIEAERKACNAIIAYLSGEARQATASTAKNVYTGAIDAVEAMLAESGMWKCDGCGWTAEEESSTFYTKLCQLCARSAYEDQRDRQSDYNWDRL